MTIKYLPIWEVLKTDKTVTLAVPKLLHDKVIKEVIRIKDEDLLFKFSEAERRVRNYIGYKQDGARIIITMREIPVLKELSPDEF